MRAVVRVLAMCAWLGCATSCATTPPAIPVGGSAEGAFKLAGSWSGDYSSQATQRYGSIRFTLAVDSDTAYGDVTMQPRRPDVRSPSASEGGHATPPPPLQVLRIAFVLATGDAVSGMLEPYPDPECSCMLITRFEGKLHGNRIDGRYFSTNVETGMVTHGEWGVRRQ